MVKVEEFLVERWMNKYEHDVEVNMAETCVQPFTLREFLGFVDRPGFLEEIMDTQLTYGWIEGSPELREGIAGLYRDVDPGNVLVTGGAIEANFNSFYSLVEPGDTVVCVYPAYQQLYSVPQCFGAKVKYLRLTPENRWLPDLEELKELVDRKTMMIVINNPHNPCGSLIDTPTLRAICDVAEDAGAYLHSDEAYRGLYLKEGVTVPSAIDLYEKAVVTGSFSKPISLTGLRLGWIASNTEAIQECMRHRDYTTISKGMIDDALATLAIRNIDKILRRNNGIIRENHRFIDRWLRDEPLMEWVPPTAGSAGFLKHHLNVSAEELCRCLIEEKSTFMVPGDCFGFPDHVRIGYGNNLSTLREGFRRVKEHLDAVR
jgi:aspartate/methionine/tyrosine aminotransferase